MQAFVMTHHPCSEVVKAAESHKNYNDTKGHHFNG
jgi:hypothetical protein